MTTVQEFVGNLGSPLPLYFLVGEPFQREEALRYLLDFLLPEARDLNLDLLWGDEFDISAFVSSLRPLPMGPGRRVLLVRSCEWVGRDAWRRLSPVLRDIPNYVSVVFSGEKLDRKLVPEVKEALWAEFGPLRGRKLVRWLIERAKELGKELPREAAELLTVYLGEDLTALAGELEKLSSYLGRRRRIEAKDVQEVTGAWAVRTFQLTDAVGGKDLARAASSLRSVLESGQPVNFVLAILRKHWETLARLKVKIKEGGSKSKLAADLGVHPYFLDGYIDQVELRSDDEIALGMDAIVEAEHKVRSGGDPEAVLNVLVWKLCRSRKWRGP